MDTIKITITDEAHNWFVKEMGLEKGDGVRFFGKVYGKTEVHDNFSVGMKISEPEEPLAQVTINDIIYFAEKMDEWFFSGYDFKVEYDEQLDEVTYRFSENK